MTDRVFPAWLLASVGLHATGLLVASALATSHETPPLVTVPIEVVRMEAPPPPPPPPPPRRVLQRAPAPTKPPRLPNPVENVKIADAPPSLLDETPQERPQAARSPVASILPPSAALVMGGPAGAGKLFAGGDLLVPPGSGIGSGPGGTSGRGDSTTGRDGPVVASATGLTSLARPLGGYQIKPEYPEPARRARIEGTTMLRFVVLATGRVGSVTVAESAGHADLDRAAVEAIKQWQFEPARRGATAVAVWVTLPVRFELTGP